MLNLPRRALAGAVAGSALLLAGCAVPGQPVAPGAAAELDGTTLTNERVSTLYDVWLEDIGAPANRRQVITVELMRQALLEETDQIDFAYARSVSRQQAEALLEINGVTGDPSEDLVDAVEGSLLIAAFSVLTEDMSVIQSVAEQVEAEAVTSPRTGTFSAAAFMQSLTVTAEKATAAAQQGQPSWYLEFNDVTGLVEPDSPWIVSE